MATRMSVVYSYSTLLNLRDGIFHELLLPGDFTSIVLSSQFLSIKKTFVPVCDLQKGGSERHTKREHKQCPLDANIYATRKTVAQGMMDIALLTANASQLKYVLATGDAHDYYLISLVLIGSSMTLQIMVGILLVVVGRWNINNRKEQNVANVTNNIIVILIFLITVVNVLITAFGDEGSDFSTNYSQWSESRKDLLNHDSSRLERDLKVATMSAPHV